MVFEQKSPPNSKNIYESVTPDNKWREFMVAVPATQSLGKSDSQIKLFFVGKGVVEVGPASLENLGPKVDLTKLPQYLGRTPYVVNPEWRRKNDAQIAAVRKGSLTVVVTKSQGKPLRDVTVKVTQLTHRFRFGTAIPVGLMMQEDADGDHIRQVIKRMFNTVTFGNDLKWNGGGPELFPDWIYPAYAWIHKNGIDKNKY